MSFGSGFTLSSIKMFFALKRQKLLMLLSVFLLLAVQPGYAQDSVKTNPLDTSTVTSSAATTAQIEPQTSPVQTTSTPAHTAVVQTATPITNKAVAAPIGGGRHLVNVTLALMGIIGLIFALSWFVKRFNQGSFSANAHIKILSAMPLGTRERIVLIEAGGQQLLLGITSTNINTLHVFETPVVVDSNEGGQSDFSRKLMSILQQKTTLSTMQNPDNKNNSAP